jgi:hypothetical protein
LEVGRHKAEANVVLILFRVRLSNEKIRVTRPLKATRERTSDLLTKLPVIPAFIQFRLEFEEHKYFPTSQAISWILALSALELRTPFNKKIGEKNFKKSKSPTAKSVSQLITPFGIL